MEVTTVGRHRVVPRHDAEWTLQLARPLTRRVLALGVETKNRLAMGRGSALTLYPALGDLAEPSARTALENRLTTLLNNPATRPDLLAVDGHPDMVPSHLGRRLGHQYGIPVVAVQHQQAHAAACMAEHGLEASLALVCDGMGWGTDANLWGAELFQVVGGQVIRLGTFVPVPLPGGDAAVRHPVRQLVGRLVQAGVTISKAWQQRLGVSETEIQIWTQQCRQGVNAPLSHAAGRLFDAFAAWLGVAPATIAHEGEPAMLLEATARRWTGGESSLVIPFAVREDANGIQVDWAELFRTLSPLQVTEDLRPKWAYAFHQAVALALARMITHGQQRTGLPCVVLSGGVFMNQLLLKLLLPILGRNPCQVYQHQDIPPGDAGIAMGQVWLAERLV
ncbi:MAG: hypothetical protein H7833_16965 [Magnetococcus sp. DMHC-1]|nr:hypothetical protein [Magnetococcales bacterium]